jgi:hypothetical protein
MTHCSTARAPKAGELAGAFLQRWPSLQQAKRAHPGTLKRFFHEHKLSERGRITERIQAIQSGTPATSDVAVLEASTITVFERRIAELVAAHPDGAMCACADRKGVPVYSGELVHRFRWKWSSVGDAGADLKS